MPRLLAEGIVSARAASREIRAGDQSPRPPGAFLVRLPMAGGGQPGEGYSEVILGMARIEASRPGRRRS
jgi:hypothetical protein